MAIIPLPKKVSYEHGDNHVAKLVIEPLFPGYGITVGNALRRVLLSSLHGVAIDSMKIKGVDHEFSALAHVKEDIVEIMLNVKKIRVKAHNELGEEVKLRINKTGEGAVTAGDIQVPSDVEISNPEQVIATVTDAAGEFDAEFTVSEGIGYHLIDSKSEHGGEVGVIMLDRQYSPIVNVGMETHNVRVDNMTNYDSLELAITTDGTRTAEEAVSESIEILLEQFEGLKEVKGESDPAAEVVEPEEAKEEAPAEEKSDEA